MVHLNDDASSVGFPGPLVDDAAPYSGVGLREFYDLQEGVMPKWNGNLEPLPNSVKGRPYWQYGRGEHSSKPRRILGSVFLITIFDQGTPVGIRHLIIDGSSSWVIGRNVTPKANINHIGGN